MSEEKEKEKNEQDDKAAKKAAAKAARKERQEQRKAAKNARKKRRQAAWNSPLTPDGSYMFTVNLVVIFMVLGFLLFVVLFLIKVTKVPFPSEKTIHSGQIDAK